MERTTQLMAMESAMVTALLPEDSFSTGAGLVVGGIEGESVRGRVEERISVVVSLSMFVVVGKTGATDVTGGSTVVETGGASVVGRGIVGLNWALTADMSNSKMADFISTAILELCGVIVSQG